MHQRISPLSPIRRVSAAACSLLALLFLGSPALWSQTPSLSFQRISLEEGLSVSTILCILQDREGFMWIGTQDGLNRYDGYRFTVYRHDRADPVFDPQQLDSHTLRGRLR